MLLAGTSEGETGGHVGSPAHGRGEEGQHPAVDRRGRGARARQVHDRGCRDRPQPNGLRQHLSQSCEFHILVYTVR